MRKLNKIKATYTTLAVLPLAVSLTACQSAVSQPETQPESSFAGAAHPAKRKTASNTDRIFSFIIPPFWKGMPFCFYFNCIIPQFTEPFCDNITNRFP
mgnify:CR=1 FL=1